MPTNANFLDVNETNETRNEGVLMSVSFTEKVDKVDTIKGYKCWCFGKNVTNVT